MRSIPNILHTAVFFVITGALSTAVSAPAQVPLRLDLYDGVDNHLMFMTFKYDAQGYNTGRTMYTADSTFIREVAINYDSSGKRSTEVSYNFNGDTVLFTNYQPADNGASFTIRDQFRLDQVGDQVVYTNNDPLNFQLLYKKTSEQAAAVKYTNDPATGQLLRVDITGQSVNDTYFGIFSNGEAIGVTRSGPNVAKLPQVSVHARSSYIEVHFNLHSAGEVRCELLTLSGRRAALLFNGHTPEGAYTRRFNITQDAALTSGLYLLRVSVNGTGVSHSTYLHQSRTGGIR